MRVPFLDLQSDYKQISSGANRALRRLFQRGDFILGRDVKMFEEDFSRYNRSRFALGVNSGTDALFLSLRALGIGPGDEVIIPVYTYIATAFAVSYAGAKPVFADIDPKTFNISPASVEKAFTPKTRAIIPVHLYGQAADMDPLCELAKSRGVRIIEDAAQAHGCEYKGRRAGAIGDIGAFSFYPTKNLGAFGDAGMVLTDDETLFGKLQKLRDYGRKSRYEHESLGYNSRLDSVQAVFLREKLRKLDAWNRRRAQIARQYRDELKDAAGLTLPFEAAYGKHVYHIFAVRVPHRDRILDGLKNAGVQAAVHYPVPLHLQDVYRCLEHKKGDFPIAEAIASDVLCLPIFPHMKPAQVAYVAKTLKGLLHG